MELTFGSAEQSMLERSVASVAKASGTGFAFGGYVSAGSLRLSAIVGNRTARLAGLLVRPERGLGGQAMAENRARIVGDYATSSRITHDYDGAVIGEGVIGLFAVPVVVDGVARGVVYSASHDRAPSAAGSTQPVFELVASLSRELTTRAEAENRVAELTERAAAARLDPRELRESCSELHRIVGEIEDSGLRGRLEALEQWLAGMTGNREPSASAAGPQLSPRERDVLIHASIGRSNREIGAALGVREVTVKGYMATAMAKLNATNRHAAVVAARRVGLIV